MRLMLILLLCIFSWGAAAETGQSQGLFTAEEREWIAAHPLINVAVDDDWRPLEYIEDGIYKGLSAEYLRAISKVSGLQFRWVSGVGSQDGGRQALLDGKVELLPAIAKTLTPVGLRHKIAYTTPYFVGASMVVTPADARVVFDLGQLTSKRIAIKAGGVYERMLRRRFPALDLVPVASVSDALEAVESGRVDAAIGVDAAVMPILRRRHFSTLHIAGTLSDMPVVASMGVRPNDLLLLSIIDKSLASLTALQTDQMLEQWMEDADYGEPSWASIFQYYRWPMLITSVLFLAVLFSAYRALLARRRAERSERDKAMFIAVMSHEIRTPMNAILSSVELLERSSLGSEQAQLAKAALTGANTLLGLLNDVLDYSKMEANRLVLDCKASNIGEVVREMVSVVQVRAQEKGLPLKLDLQLLDDVWPVIDVHRLRQVLNNLLSNAVKFTETGHVHICVRIERDTEKLLYGKLHLSIEDTGIGIPRHGQAMLFRAFTQVDQSHTRKFGGTGLGLAICRELVELMGGEISLQSEPGHGVTVQVCIPVMFEQTPLEVAQETVASDLAKDILPAQSDALRVLVVEDHPQNRYVIECQLRALGCAALLVETGQAALEALECESFDLVLLDCNLPDIDGYAVAAQIRTMSLGDARYLPIIAISAMVGEQHIEACLAAGMDGAISKPLRLNELREVIDLWCDHDNGIQPACAPEPAVCLDGLSLLEAFVVTTRVDVEKIWSGIAARDARLVERQAHRIAGAAKTAGLFDIAMSADLLEQRAKKYPVHELPEYVITLERQLIEL